MTILGFNRKQNLKKLCSEIYRALPRSAWLILLGGLLFLWFWIFGRQGLYDLESLRRVRAELRREKVKLETEETELKAKLKYLDDPAYQKYLIHKELGWVEPDEAVIQLPRRFTDPLQK